MQRSRHKHSQCGFAQYLYTEGDNLVFTEGRTRCQGSREAEFGSSKTISKILSLVVKVRWELMTNELEDQFVSI